MLETIWGPGWRGARCYSSSNSHGAWVGHALGVPVHRSTMTDDMRDEILPGFPPKMSAEPRFFGPWFGRS